MKIKITLPTYLMAIAMMVVAFSACSSGTHLTKCPDFKGQQEQAKLSKKKIKKQKKNERIVKTRKIEKTQELETLALLDQRELLQIPNTVNQAVALPETSKKIAVEWKNTENIASQLSVLDQTESALKIQQLRKDFVEDFNALSKIEQKAKKKEVRQALKSAKNQAKHGGADPDILLIVLTVLVPPLGMFLYEDGATGRFWLSLVLTILGYLPGLIYSLYVILTQR